MADEAVTSAEPSVMPTEAPSSAKPRATAASWLARIAASKAHVTELLSDWRENVNFRVVKPFKGDAGGEGDRIALPEDWTRTKQKQAQLSFQLPKIVAEHTRPEHAQTAPIVSAAVNHTLARECKAHYAIDEGLADAINAAGLMALKAEVEVLTETLPQTGQPALPGMELTPASVSRVVARKFHVKRISPANLLWPREFIGSRWETSPWIGHRAFIPYEIVRKHEVWGKQLPAEFKPTDAKPDLLSSDVDTDRGVSNSVPCCEVIEIFYHARDFDQDATHPDHLRTIVFITGVDQPVEHGDVDDQEWVPPAALGQLGYYKGLTTYPIRVETLTYVSDLAVPPSDTRVGRSQVLELMRSRRQMIQQRDASIPMRWFDTNRVDATIVERIEAGTWQGLIPVNGPGERVLGEVARANYPRENFTFQSIMKTDLDGAWALSNNQRGLPNEGERSATEINAVSSAGATRTDYEKARINRMIAELAGVLWSLMQRWTTAPDYVTVVGQDGVDTLTQVPPDVFNGWYTFDFVPDSSDRQDISVKQANITKLMNILGNAEFINKKNLAEEVLRLHGYDPKKFVVEPQPRGPEPPKIGYSFKGEDLTNPMAVAIMLKAQEIGPDDIKAAAMMIADSMAQVKTVMVPTPGVKPAAADPKLATAPIQPPETLEPILKRAGDGTHLT